MIRTALRNIIVGLGSFGLVSSILAQAPASDTRQRPVIRATTRLVLVNVIAQDKKGQPVLGLTRDDFKVLDGGKEQKISVFSMESSHALPPPPRPLPSNVFSNRPEMRGSVPTSVTVILLDGLNTHFEDQVYAREQIVKFLGQLKPEDRVALYALGSSLRVVHDFTSDATALLRALGRYRGRIATELSASEPGEAPGPNISDPSDPVATELDAFLRDAEQRIAEFYTIRRAEQTLRALEAIAQHLSNIPGRKNLIWVSGSFPAWIGFDSLNPSVEKRTFSPEVGRAVEALNSASLAIYPVDARGLIASPGFSAARRGPPSGNEFSKISLTLDTMNELAERTGGLAFYNTNDIRGAVRSAIDDSRVTYVLGFYATHNQWDKKFREIKVRVDRSGVRLRYRRGYFAMPEEPLDEKQLKVVLEDATWSPLEATAISIVARVDPPPTPGDGPLGIKLLLNPTEVTLQPEKDRWSGSLDVLLLQRDSEGKVLSGTSKTINLSLKSETYKTVMHEGLILTDHEKVEPAASELRVVVRDTPSGALGSVNIPLGKFLEPGGVPPPTEKPK